MCKVLVMLLHFYFKDLHRNQQPSQSCFFLEQCQILNPSDITNVSSPSKKADPKYDLSEHCEFDAAHTLNEGLIVI